MNNFTVARIVCTSSGETIGEVRVNGEISEVEAMNAINAEYDISEINIIYGQKSEYELEEIAYYMMLSNYLDVRDNCIEYLVYIDKNGRLSPKSYGTASFPARVSGPEYLKITSEDYNSLMPDVIFQMIHSKERLEDVDFMKAVKQVADRLNSYIS